MDSDEFARILMSASRRTWQDPDAILSEIGVEEGMTVADLACGPGYFTVPIAKAVGATGTVYAVDFDSVMLEHLRRNLSRAGLSERNVVILESDIAATSIPPGSVDVALFANVLHDIEDKVSFLGEVKRVCRLDGVAVDVDWKKVRTEMGPPYDIRMSEGSATRVLVESGFDVARPIEAGPYHYGLLCRRRGEKSSARR